MTNDNNKNDNESVTPYKEFGLSSKFSTAKNLISTKDLVVLPLLSANSSEISTRRFINGDTAMDLDGAIIDGPSLNKFDMLVFFSLIKYFDTHCHDSQYTFQSAEVNFADLFELMELPKNQRKIYTKEKINASVNRIRRLSIIKKQTKRATIVINFISDVNLDLDKNDESFEIFISNSFISYFRESTEDFLCHVDISTYNNLGVNAARFYLYLTANQNFTYVARKYVDMIFDLLTVDENNVVTHQVPERDATKRVQNALDELKDANLLNFGEIKKNAKTRKIEKINFNVNKNKFQNK